MDSMRITKKQAEQFFRFAYIAMGAVDQTRIAEWKAFRHEFFDGKLKYVGAIKPHTLKQGSPISWRNYQEWCASQQEQTRAS